MQIRVRQNEQILFNYMQTPFASKTCLNSARDEVQFKRQILRRTDRFKINTSF